MLEQITMKIIRCLRQLKRPQIINISRKPDEGECTICEYNAEENPKCANFYPVTVIIDDSSFQEN